MEKEIDKWLHDGNPNSRCPVTVADSEYNYFRCLMIKDEILGKKHVS